MLKNCCDGIGVEVVLCTHWADGSAGTEALAHAVVKAIDKGGADFKFLYPDDMGLLQKVRTIAQKLYGASDIVADKRIRDRFAEFESRGFKNLPVCIAKTQYSFSTDPALFGAPSDHVVPIREVRLSGGAEFIVVICGDIMTMPGLPSKPAAHDIRINEKGDVEGLF
jgi:formate--tetrahydrofolate ligase